LLISALDSWGEGFNFVAPNCKPPKPFATRPPASHRNGEPGPSRGGAAPMEGASRLWRGEGGEEILS